MSGWHTPEALLPRSDSRLESETCKGICVNGRRCRRKLSPPSTPRRNWAQGGEPFPTTNPFYCWQHQPNVEELNQPKSPVRTTIRPKSSIDTLAERMGILRVSESKTSTSLLPERGTTRPKVVETLDEKRPWPQTRTTETKPALQTRPPQARQVHHKRAKQSSFLASLCCMGLSSTDEFEIVRHRQKRPPMTEKPQTRAPLPASWVPARPNPPLPSSNPWIPSNLPPRIAALLQLELSKSIAPADEPGYIYMYWVTDETIPSPPVTTVLQKMPSPTASWDSSAYQSSRSQNSTTLSQLFTVPTTFLVKIGRATNVHKRLVAWQRQCGYQLSLLRFYPHVPVSKHDSQLQGLEVRMVPCSHRVERLIQIELEGRRAKRGTCDRCGRAHREWFELEATVEGLAEVDGVIKRWVEWGSQRLGET